MYIGLKVPFHFDSWHYINQTQIISYSNLIPCDYKRLDSMKVETLF